MYYYFKNSALGLFIADFSLGILVKYTPIKKCIIACFQTCHSNLVIVTFSDLIF